MTNRQMLADAAKIMQGYYDVFGGAPAVQRLITEINSSLQQQEHSTVDSYFAANPDQLREVVVFLDNGEKLSAVKLIRLLTGVPLREASIFANKYLLLNNQIKISDAF
jgi:ribosomal protein L7/L12